MSSPRKKVSFPAFPEEIKLPKRQTSWRQKLADMKTLWSRFSTTFHQYISITRLIKVLIFIHAILLIISVITIRFAPEEEFIAEREDEYVRGREQEALRENRKTIRGQDNRISHQFEPYELVSPLYDLVNLDVGPQLDVVKDAYSDSRYGLNRLRDGLPELSKYSPELSVKIRRFRDQVWTVSEAIGGLSKALDVYINFFQRETNRLREEIGKVKPGDELANLDAENCKKVGEVWINHYKRLKAKIRNVWRIKSVVSNIIDSAVQERKDLEKALRKAETSMTKEATKQGWDNFDFPSAYQLLNRFSRGGKNKDKIWGGHEEMINRLIIYIDVSLKDANAQIERLVEDFQQISSVDDNRENVDSTSLPTIFNQMEALNLTFEKYVRVKVQLEDMKKELEKELKPRAHDSKERNRYYNYVASQQKGRFDKHIIASRDRREEEFLQELRERRVKEGQKGG
ncbi:hypothetical protein BOTCAL_0356g00040 [Botryotinia calthae]|uniref:Uncharacterized protein n=1 Tax=Botryotinia calthae TaxID=38488 RepID=A0A4Y8CUU1_9HELO|nr:hypothetical protein BOTCAL_0356g00040 [Botryotinia calthae]